MVQLIEKSKLITLKHELRNDTMEAAALVSETLFTCAQSSEIS